MAISQTHIQQAKTAIKNGNKQYALVLLQEAIRQDPNDYQAWLMLAGVTDSPQQSLEYIERAEMLNPHAADVAKARIWVERRLANNQSSSNLRSTELKEKGSRKPFIWATLGIMLIFISVTAVILFLNFRPTQTTQSPRQLADSGPTPIIEMTATPTVQAVAEFVITTEPHIQAKQIAANDLADRPRAEWTITPTPTNTPSPTPTLVPTFLAPQVGKPAIRPFGVDSTENWIDVNLSTQTLNAYEGTDLVYTTKVSSGTNENPTVTGMFRVWLRLESQTMDGARLGYDYYLENVPYVMYFFEDYALHGAYWHNNFGYQMSHGCVNLAPSDAGWLFNWSAYGTVVNVHH